MTGRIPLDHLTSDALDALYEQLEAAEQTESERQLATAREALASATTRAARAEAALARVRALHSNGYGLCDECTGSHGVPWPCPTIRALDQPSPAATGATEPAGWLLAGTRDLSIPDTTKEN